MRVAIIIYLDVGAHVIHVCNTSKMDCLEGEGASTSITVSYRGNFFAIFVKARVNALRQLMMSPVRSTKKLAV